MTHDPLLDDLLSASAPAVHPAPERRDLLRMARAARRSARGRRTLLAHAALGGGVVVLLAGGTGVAYAAGLLPWQPALEDPDLAYAFTAPSGRACEARAASDTWTEAQRAAWDDIDGARHDWLAQDEAARALSVKLAELDPAEVAARVEAIEDLPAPWEMTKEAWLAYASESGLYEDPADSGATAQQLGMTDEQWERFRRDAQDPLLGHSKPVLTRAGTLDRVAYLPYVDAAPTADALHVQRVDVAVAELIMTAHSGLAADGNASSTDGALSPALSIQVLCEPQDPS